MAVQPSDYSGEILSPSDLHLHSIAVATGDPIADNQAGESVVQEKEIAAFSYHQSREVSSPGGSIHLPVLSEILDFSILQARSSNAQCRQIGSGYVAAAFSAGEVTHSPKHKPSLAYLRSVPISQAMRAVR